VLLQVQRGEFEGETASGYTTLHLLAGGGSSDYTSLLLQRGCPVDVRAVRGCSRVLAWAIGVPLAPAEERAPRCDAWWVPCALQADGSTPLHIAAKEGSAPFVSALLAAGASPTATKVPSLHRQHRINALALG
jgi:ankyrin repeat protein